MGNLPKLLLWNSLSQFPGEQAAVLGHDIGIGVDLNLSTYSSVLMEGLDGSSVISVISFFSAIEIFFGPILSHR